ncbi:hypothetical protein V2J09_022948 [Rumex salicifolius]
MGKAGKWIKSFLIGGGKKDKVDREKEKNTSIVAINPIVIPPTPKDKKRWSFRRSSATAPKDSTPTKHATTSPPPHHDHDGDQKKMPHDTTITSPPPPQHDDCTPKMDEKALTLVQEDAAATKIQSVFRSYLARKALRALRGLVKIQALVRGHLVRKQATATLRCMQALVTAQARARAHRIRSSEEDNHNHDFNFPNSYHGMESGMMMTMMEENIKIVEMDQGESKPNLKIKSHNNDNTFPTQMDYYYTTNRQMMSPAPSAMTDISPRTCSAHFEDYSYTTAQSSPQCYYSAVSRPDPSRIPFAFPHPQDYTDSSSFSYGGYDCPNYMANTQSSRAKARSQSAPKQRPETYERQLSRRRPSVEGRNIPRAVRMQRSSSHVGAAAQNYQLPWSIKLDKSTVSLRDSECGSTCSVLTNANYCRTVVSSYDEKC